LKGSASFLIRTSVNAPIIFRKWQIEKRFSKNDFVQRRTERVSMVRKKWLEMSGLIMECKLVVRRRRE
jgi:hypothetical protein